ncbi:hypothetical protein LXL04_036324 [Taraxacum kok-saghyz]
MVAEDNNMVTNENGGEHEESVILNKMEEDDLRDDSHTESHMEEDAKPQAVHSDPQCCFDPFLNHLLQGQYRHKELQHKLAPDWSMIFIKQTLMNSPTFVLTLSKLIQSQVISSVEAAAEDLVSRRLIKLPVMMEKNPCTMDGYVKSGNIELAKDLFDEMTKRYVVSCTNGFDGTSSLMTRSPSQQRITLFLPSRPRKDGMNEKDTELQNNMQKD